MTLGLAARVAVGAAFLAAAAPDGFTPARYLGGSPPPIPVQAIGGGEVFVELTVDESGLVTAVTPLRTTPPFTDAVVNAVRDWTFTPAIEAATSSAPARGVATRILVAAVFRPPSLNAPTFGVQPQDVAAPSDAVAVPTSTVMPPFPPNALFDGTVLVECHVGPAGQLLGTKVLRSKPPFDRLALDAVKQWTFRPATHGRQRVDAYTYVSFSFRQPIT